MFSKTKLTSLLKMQNKPTMIRPFSRKDRMIQEQAEEEAK